MKEHEAQERQARALESIDQTLKLLLFHVVKGGDQGETEETETEDPREVRYQNRRSEA